MSSIRSVRGPARGFLLAPPLLCEPWGHLVTAIAAPLATQVMVFNEMYSDASKAAGRPSMAMRRLSNDLAAVSG